MKVTIRQTVTRLKHLERVMREVAKKPPEAFKMGRWAFKWEKGEEGAPPCGTSACCAGWAGLDKRIQAMGLRTTMLNRYSNAMEEQAHIRCRGYRSDHFTYRSQNFEHARAFFGVTYKQATALFASVHCTATKKAGQVARLRAVYERRLAKASK